MAALFLLILYCLAGFAVVRAFWPAPMRWSPADPIRLALSLPVGMALASLVFYFCYPSVMAAAVFVAAGAIIAAIAVIRARNAAPDRPAISMPPPSSWLRWSFVLALAATICMYLLIIYRWPRGDWDAWCIWNLRATFLFHGRDIFDPTYANYFWSHPDYPLLLSGSIALLWKVNGEIALWVPWLLHFLILLTALAVPMTVIRQLRGEAVALIAGLVLLTARPLVAIAASLYSDVLFASIFAGATAALTLANSDDPIDANLVRLAGFLTGMAAWTKNEGLLFFCVLTAVLVVAIRLPIRKRLSAAFPFLAAAAPFLAVLAHYKRHMPVDPEIAAASGHFFNAILDAGRYKAVLTGYLAEAIRFPGMVLPSSAVLALWRLWGDFHWRGLRSLPIAPLAAAIQHAGYAAVYLITPNDIAWHIGSSLTRLLLQTWPAIVMGICLIGYKQQRSD